ncbi:MAG: response regulator, partial [Romboutsia sp.]|nr:response regulator [Romboutsia sp.]
MYRPTILIVDDQASTRKLLVAHLEHFGYRIIQAQNGIEAISIYLKHKPDLILLDVIMPDISGFEVAQQIRKLERESYKHANHKSNATNDIEYWTPIIFITADTNKFEKGIECGGDDYLIKPISLPLVKAKIDVFLRIIKARSNYIDKYYELYNEKISLEFEQKLSTGIFNLSPYGIICIDSNCNILMSNDAANHILKIEPSKIIGKNIIEFIPKKYLEKYNNFIKEYLQTKTKYFFGKTKKFTAIDSNNREFPISLRINEFTVNLQTYFVGIIEDITQQEQISSRLKDTSKLEAMGVLTAGIAHDFNNIL